MGSEMCIRDSFYQHHWGSGRSQLFCGKQCLGNQCIYSRLDWLSNRKILYSFVFFHLRIPVFPRDKRRGGNTENTEENAYEGTLPDTSLFIMESVIFPFHYFSSAHPRHWIKNQFGFSDSASNKKYPGIISFHFLGAGRFPFVVSSIPDSFCSVLSHILCFIL